MQQPREDEEDSDVQQEDVRSSAHAVGEEEAPPRRRRDDTDLGKMHAQTKYNRQSLRAKVPWYRNSFEDAEGVPTTELPLEPVELDPPLVIPNELRPLGYKCRYLRTIQLIDAPLPPAVAERTYDSIGARRTASRKPERSKKASTPTGSTKRATGQQQTRLGRTVSFPALHAVHASRHVDIEERDAVEDSIVSDDEEGEENGDKDLPQPKPTRVTTQGRRRRDQPLASSKSHGRLTPLHQASDRIQRRAERENSRRLSVEEVEDLGNSDSYFGDRAKSQFFSQYRQIYSKPYLFVEDPAQASTREARDQYGYINIPSQTQSSFIPAYPSSSYLKGVEQSLAAVGSGVEFGDSYLPTEDKLSPRSQFLTAAIAQPQMAVPFMLRKAMTKVYDFSFQSLGDAFMIEFAKCLKNELPYIEEINVRDNRLSDEGLDVLLQAIVQGSTMLHLHRLDISQNMIGAKSAQTLRAFVVTSYCSLRSLLVDNADIDDSECASFMTAFEKNLSIRELWMSRNGIGKSEHLNVVQPDFVTGGEAIASMLHSNLVLVHLDVSWNYLRLESSITLARSMFENHTLVILNVSYNACGDDGAMMFGEALRANQCLEVLNLAYNSIGCKGAQVLAHALRANRTLKSLVLDGNCIGREGGQQLMLALCDNKNVLGCDISLHACNLSSSVVSTNETARSLVKEAQQPSTTSGVPSQPPSYSADLNPALFPQYGGSCSSVFSSKEPTGRYTLHLHEPYDRMMATELVRLATVKKGCRFVKVEYRTTPGATKKPVQLIRKEVKPRSSMTKRAPPGAGDDPLETLGLDAFFMDVFDRDHSGDIDRHEVMAVLNQIGLFPKADHLENVLEKLDLDNLDVLANNEEFSAFFFHAVFQIIDSDGSGKIDGDEIEEAFKMLGITDYDEKEILEAIAMYDITGDGEMEEVEFVAFMKDKLLERIKEQLIMSTPNQTISEGDGGGDQTPFAAIINASTQKPWRIPDDGILEVDFLYEREAFATNEEAYRYARIPQASIDKLIHNILDLADSKSEQEELLLVAVHDSELRFTASQAYQILEACGLLKPVERKIESIALILPQMLTAKEAQVLVSRALTLRQRCRLKAEMNSAYSVIMGNPTAHYSFDLCKPKDRVALAKIAEVAQSEKLFSKLKSGRADTSQHGNWENFRNEEFDGEKIVLTTSFFHVMPKRGKLSFDYVSTARPKKGTSPLSEHRFQQLIQELQTSIQLPGVVSVPASDHTEDSLGELPPLRGGVAGPKPNGDAGTTIGNLRPPPLSKSLSVRTKKTEFWDKTRTSVLKKAGWEFLQTTSFRFTSTNTTKETVALKLVQIESSICDRWISSAQAAQIVACMPAQFHARPETARILFSRLIDIGSFYRILDGLSPDDQYVCAKSLGWLNIFNPMAPERYYSLDLSIWDEREMTKLLVQLAITEPGENWINQYFSMVRGEPGIPGWKLPVRWEKEDEKDYNSGVNRAGYLELEYYSGEDRGCASVPSFRKTLMSSVLVGTKLYCL